MVWQDSCTPAPKCSSKFEIVLVKILTLKQNQKNQILPATVEKIQILHQGNSFMHVNLQTLLK